MNYWDTTTAIEVGSRVEVRRYGHEGEPALVIAINEVRAIVRFEDHAEISVHPHLLTWLPSPTEIRAAKVALRAKHLAEMRARKSPEEIKDDRRRRLRNRRTDKCPNGYT